MQQPKNKSCTRCGQEFRAAHGRQQLCERCRSRQSDAVLGQCSCGTGYDAHSCGLRLEGFDPQDIPDELRADGYHS